MQIDDKLFTATGTNIIDPGWFAVDAMPEVTGLPTIVKDNDYKVIGFDVKEGQNEPPKYYTDATLLTAMELAGNNITDEQTRSYIKLTKRGLGTAATRQGIIKELYDKGYIARRTRKNGNAVKSIMPTEKGMYIINTLEKIVPDMLSVDMTGDMEMELDKIARGESDGNNFLNEYKKLVIKWVEQIKNSDTSRIIQSLMRKGYITHILAAYRKDNRKGTYTYVLNPEKNKVKSDYTRIDRNVFNKKLSAPELRLYILIMKSIDSKLGYCFKSFNDLADELNIKRDTAMKIVSNLVNLRLIRKQRKMRYDNRNVYADNSYSLKVIRFIKKRNKPGLHSGLISTKYSDKQTDNLSELNSLRNYNNSISTICQVGQGAYSVIFFKNRGSPRNLRSIQYPVILPSERKKILYIRI